MSCGTVDDDVLSDDFSVCVIHNYPLDTYFAGNPHHKLNLSHSFL